MNTFGRYFRLTTFGESHGPYVIVVASCAFVGYLVAGIAGNGWIGVVAGFVLLAIAMTYIYKVLMKD